MSRDREDLDRDLDHEKDGLRPDELEGPDQAEASPKRCEFAQGERSSGAGEDSSFEVMDELHESFPIEEIPTVLGADGMPEFHDANIDGATAIPFTYETQLCIEDDRVYVEIFAEELAHRGWRPKNAKQWLTPDGKELSLGVRSRYDKSGHDEERRSFDPAEVECRWGVPMVGTVPVRPIREQCRHFKQQVFSNDDQPDPELPGHQIVFRLCAARRSNGGAFMSLGNEGIYHCDFRDPYDVPSANLQRSKDKKKLVERPDLKLLPLFNLDGDVVQLENKSKP